MPIKFEPNFRITPRIASLLLQIEAAKERSRALPLTPSVLAHLRETSKLMTTHYSTMIEGNRLAPEEIDQVLKHEGHFPGRVRDEAEVKGYYAALQEIERVVAKGAPITEQLIQKLHALVMGIGRANVQPTPYRDGQNVIRDSQTKGIIYMPPEAKDVPALMHGFVVWLNQPHEEPLPLIAAIAHYQFATIHPYYDGNGRVARLLTTLVLHLGGYDLKGLYSLEEYYARDLGGYYEAISIGPSHNYYLGRAEADITKWIEYFIAGMVYSFDKVLTQMKLAQTSGAIDHSDLLRQLDPKQRKALELFVQFEAVTSRQIGDLFGFKERNAASLCKRWIEMGFLQTVNLSRKARKYSLAERYRNLL